MQVRERMSAPVLTVRDDADYKSALALMQQHRVHHVPVVDARGELAGILAERDLLLAATRYLQSQVDVADVMHRDVVTVTPRTGLARAARLLARHKIGGLPVVGANGRLVGVITESDLLATLVDVLKTRPGVSRRVKRPAGRAKVSRKVGGVR